MQPMRIRALPLKGSCLCGTVRYEVNQLGLDPTNTPHLQIELASREPSTEDIPLDDECW